MNISSRRSAQPTVHVKKRVGQIMDYALLSQPGDELHNIAAALPPLPELRLVQSQGDNVNFRTVVRKAGCELTTDDHSGQMGYLQSSVNGVVISYGYVIHAAFPGDFIDAVGRGKALWTIDLSQGVDRRLVGILGVDVKISFFISSNLPADCSEMV